MSSLAARNEPIRSCRILPILSEKAQKKLNASDEEKGQQESQTDDGKCRPARIVTHTSNSLYAKSTATSGGTYLGNAAEPNVAMHRSIAPEV